MERPVPWPTVVAAVASLVVLSSGPLFRLRTWWDFEDPLATDATIVVVNAAVGLVALSWLASQGRFRLLDQRALTVAAALVGWLLLGSLWSLDRLETMRHALQIATALTIGAAVAAALGAVWFRWALWAALQVGLGWSIAAIYLDRSGTIDVNGDWAGIFFNRNSLALYAALALLVAVFIAADTRSIESPPRRWSVVAVLVAFGIVDVRLIAGSDALTPLVAVSVALAAVGLCSARRRTAGGCRRRGRACGRGHQLGDAALVARQSRPARRPHRPPRPLERGARLGLAPPAARIRLHGGVD
jgi:hypothetical protein